MRAATPTVPDAISPATLLSHGAPQADSHTPPPARHPRCAMRWQSGKVPVGRPTVDEADRPRKGTSAAVEEPALGDARLVHRADLDVGWRQQEHPVRDPVHATPKPERQPGGE